MDKQPATTSAAAACTTAAFLNLTLLAFDAPQPRGVTVSRRGNTPQRSLVKLGPPVEAAGARRPHHPRRPQETAARLDFAFHAKSSALAAGW
jgi:hypothetical protein